MLVFSLYVTNLVKCDFSGKSSDYERREILNYFVFWKYGKWRGHSLFEDMGGPGLRASYC